MDHDRRRILQEAITLWVGDIRLDEALKREELAHLEGIQRHLALSKSLVPNVIRICRRHPRADTRIAVQLLITLLSDNNDGKCTLSTERMGKLLGRKPENVRLAIDSLEEGGELFVDRTEQGFPNSYWPAVPTAVATMNPAVAWFVDALSPRPGPRGRPRKRPEENDAPLEVEVFEKDPPQTDEKVPREAGNGPPQTGKRSPAERDSISLREYHSPNITQDIPSGGEQARPRAPQRKTRLPDGVVVISDEAMAYAVDRGMSSEQATEQWSAFCDHHRAKGNVMADWAAAWRTWVHKAFRFGLRPDRTQSSGLGWIGAVESVAKRMQS